MFLIPRDSYIRNGLPHSCGNTESETFAHLRYLYDKRQKSTFFKWYWHWRLERYEGKHWLCCDLGESSSWLEL